MSSSNSLHALPGLALSAALLTTPAMAQTMGAEQARKMVEPFYSMLNQPAGKDIAAIANQTLAPDWKSYSNDIDFKDRNAFVAQVVGFGKLIPDLRWDIKDVMADKDRIIVRSEASGTPAGPFFGVPATGKSFRIMTIDIHTFKDGKAVSAYHVEDWAAALRQLSSK